MDVEQGSRWRFALVLSGLILLFGLLLWRAFDLMVLDRAFLLSQGNARSVRDVSIPAYRGMIVDRHGSALAVSTPVMAVWVHPGTFQLDHPQVSRLATLLQSPKSYLLKRINDNRYRQFLYLKRGVEPQLAEKIKQLALPGVFLQKEYKRFYPLGQALSQVLGFTNVDDQGLEGLELMFNEHLAGANGKKRVIKDRLGRVIDEIAVIQAPIEGHDLKLSIDKQIQYVAFRELKTAIEQAKASMGSIVVLSAKTGEILAMANYPSFNPNQPLTRRDNRFKNNAVTDVFEPGSVMKPFSVASALDSGLFTPNTLIDARSSWMKVDDNLIRDIRPYGVLSVTQVLQKSSNVGVTKMVLASPVGQLVGLFRRIGFGQVSGSGFPGESSGVLEDKLNASPFVIATLGFGYGLSVTTLQLAKAYAVIANEGKALPATLLRFGNHSAKPTQVLNKNIAADVLSMLEAVVDKNGTGKRAQVDGYRVAGKTGTSRVATQKGYDKNKHIATFVGIAPVSNPALVIAVMVREPTLGSHYGGVVAAPIFSKVMEQALRILGIAPDKPLV